jgi:exopolyphosphatase/guanosine-5'-triphosphate,3'-diphosphate pyrophosphatase
MHPGRVDVIAAGAMILGAALRAGGQPAVLVSERDILDGIVYRLATIAGPSVAGPFM